MENKETKSEEFIVIESIDEKSSKAGRKYFSVKTDKGSYSCFEYDIIKVLKENIGKKIEAETSFNKKNNGQVFKNIRRIIQIVEEVKPTKKIESNQEIVEARSLKDTSIYTSYAKDLFIAIYKPDQVPDETMELAILLVKQAKDSFK